MLDFEKLAKDIGISYTLLVDTIKEQCEKLPIVLEEVVKSFENKIGQSILTEVRKNCQKNLKKFGG